METSPTGRFIADSLSICYIKLLRSRVHITALCKGLDTTQLPTILSTLIDFVLDRAELEVRPRSMKYCAISFMAMLFSFRGPLAQRAYDSLEKAGNLPLSLSLNVQRACRKSPIRILTRNMPLCAVFGGD